MNAGSKKKVRSSVTIDFTDILSRNIENKRDRGHLEYERSKGIICNYKRFFIKLKSETDEEIGVLEAYIAFSEIYIVGLMLSMVYRGKGYGTKMIRALEDRFRGQGYNNINLVTSQF